jgi:hypothetical protein
MTRFLVDENFLPKWYEMSIIPPQRVVLFRFAQLKEKLCPAYATRIATGGGR